MHVCTHARAHTEPNSEERLHLSRERRKLDKRGTLEALVISSIFTQNKTKKPEAKCGRQFRYYKAER